MRNILLVMKNNLYRFTKEIAMVIMCVIVMPIIICLGVYFNGTDNIKGTIAIVGASTSEEELIEGFIGGHEKIKVKFLESSPTNTDLIKGVYLAEINFQGNEPTVISYGNNEVRNTLEAALRGEIYEVKGNNETVQGKIIGFLIMFLFMGAIMVMEFFLADKENGTYSRVLSGKIRYFQYVTGQMLYSIILLTIPSTIWSIIILKVLSVNLEISYMKFSILLLLVGLLSSSFGIVIATIFKDRKSASMGGSIIAMITCLLGGCLINFDDTNRIIGFIRNIIPQKRLIDLSNNFNNEDLIFVMCTIVVFISISVILGKRQFENGDFVV